MIQKVSSDCVVSLWSSTRITRAAGESAFGKIGRSDFIPTPDRYDSLVEACRQVCREVGLYGGSGSLKYESLGGGRSSLEVIRKVKGVKQNEWPFLFSARVQSEGDEFVVRLIQTTEDAGSLHKDKAAAEQSLNDYFKQYMQTISAKDLTETIVKTVRSFRASPMKSSGGSYFFPDTYAPDYLSLQADLAKHGPNLVLYGVDLKTNPQLAKFMSDAIVDEIAEGLEAMREGVSSLQAKGGKTRSNGQKKRFDQLAEYMRKVKEYHQILDLPVKQLRAAIEETRSELGLEAFRNGI